MSTRLLNHAAGAAACLVLLGSATAVAQNLGTYGVTHSPLPAPMTVDSTYNVAGVPCDAGHYPHHDHGNMQAHPCPVCCCPTCGAHEPGPRGPREGEPGGGGVPTGAYVAPPQSGTIEGPRSGMELGGLSLTMPEMTIGLPRIRWFGPMRTLDRGQMRMREATAPYIDHPMAAQQVVATRQAQYIAREAERPAQPRSAEPDQQPPEAEDDAIKKEREATRKRIEELEACLRQQNALIEECLRQLRRQPPVPADPYCPPVAPHAQGQPQFERLPPAPLPTDCTWQVPATAREADQVQSAVHVDRVAPEPPRPMRRLPALQ